MDFPMLKRLIGIKTSLFSALNSWEKSPMLLSTTPTKNSRIQSLSVEMGIRRIAISRRMEMKMRSVSMDFSSIMIDLSWIVSTLGFRRTVASPHISGSATISISPTIVRSVEMYGMLFLVMDVRILSDVSGSRMRNTRSSILLVQKKSIPI